MKTIKKFFTAMMVLILALTGLNFSHVNAQGELGNIGFSISTLDNPFFVSMAEGAEEKAAELGVKVSVVDAGNDAAKQVTDIEDLISTGISVLIVNPVDSAAVGPVVNSAIESGIRVIAVDRAVEGAEVDTFIGTDNVKAAQQVGEYMVELLEAEDQVAILEGIPGASSSIERVEGFTNALDGNVNIVAQQPANYDRAEGLTVAENILQANPDLKAIVAANDEMALGAIEAATAAGKVIGEDFYVSGFDATDDAKQSVKDGMMTVTAEQQPAEMGATAVETAVKMMNGEEVEADIPADVTLLDIENVDGENEEEVTESEEEVEEEVEVEEETEEESKE